ncbi:hypothetical protein P154DRAFT_531296 [Amniculicola lignicola CBS 123094]|uniref:Cyclin N-terminal domain-containing protein n=1 Tax=Amniculicola lignicola CBS 123094 TaxID=1392246 RepID=A0A6A5WVF9_9PLEO|nr:hypothetical protein P154DRAFT_531296 [Amniculicola lignicola CBS 123094]
MALALELEHGIISPAASPIGSVYSDDLSDEELDRYFANYVPLSNLPTPPPPHHQDEKEGSDRYSREGGYDHETPGLEESAAYLANLMNPPADVGITETALNVLKLPVEIVAFAACILDRVRTETKEAPLCPPWEAEWWIFAALALAQNFLEDCHWTTRQWVSMAVGMGLELTLKKLSRCKTTILEILDWGLMKITSKMVEAKLRVLHQNEYEAFVAKVGAGVSGTGATVSDLAHDTSTTRREPSQRGGAGEEEQEEAQEEKEKVARDRPQSTLKLDRKLDGKGRGVWLNGLQTPEPSP